MQSIKFFPAVESQAELSDLVYRSAWHLGLLSGYKFIVYSHNTTLSADNISFPVGFSEEVKVRIHDFIDRVSIVFVENVEQLENVRELAAIIKWREDDKDLNAFLKKNATCTIYRTDPKLVRQEGSFYIQCAFDLLPNKGELIKESQVKFDNLCNGLGTFDQAWILATGPSVDKYQEHDFTNALTVVCNSTVLDDSLMQKCKPKILVFADPIFHFGVSEYAGAFREIVRQRLEATDITVIVPFKYYALLLSIFPEYADRIIGVPFKNGIDFNFDISKSFAVKTTANILTLLLLPVASTFSDSVNILGCDGRSFDEDDYFWGHGKTVQINDKMQNIQEVHPGFFKIDYNEYYFEHCHTLECLVSAGEKQGKSYQHHANSFIPALRDRNESFRLDSKFTSKHCLLIEPDGIGVSGHYVSWYNQVISKLRERDNKVTVLCNKKQDANLYSTSTIKVFTSHSWGISRADWCFKKDFSNHLSFKRFFDELDAAIQCYCDENGVAELTLFMYYGSVQILSGLNKLRCQLKKMDVNVNISLCLFHESVILNGDIKEPRLQPSARQVLLESLAQSDSYQIASVTEALKSNLYKRLNVLTKVMPNPIPAEITGVQEVFVNTNEEVFRVVFPCALRDEKGSQLVSRFIKDIVEKKIEAKGLQIIARKVDGINIENTSSIEWIKDDLTDGEYRHLLNLADVIVIPYLTPQFAYRTSGIIVDVMYANKPLVVIQGTWLADIVKKYRTGLAIIPFSSDSILSAIKVIKENVGFFAKHANCNFEKFEKENNWERLIEVMFDRN